MPKGLVRSDLNHGGDSYRNGFAVTEPLEFNTPITLPHEFGTEIPVADRSLAENLVTWAPSPAHFGNVIGDEPQQATPTFAPPDGEYSSPQDVTITSAGADAIYYTTDGSVPTNPPTGTTQTYSGPVTISTDTVFQAIATRAGFLDSAVGAAFYTFVVNMALVAHTVASSNAGTGVTTTAKDTTGATLLIVSFACFGGSSHPKVITDSKSNNWHLLTEYDANGNTGNATASTVIAYAFDSGVAQPLVVGAGHTFTGDDGFGTVALAMQAWSGNTPGISPFIVGSDAGATASTGGGGTLIAPGSVTAHAAGDLLITSLGFAANSDPSVDAGFTISDFIRSTGEHCGLAYLLAADTSPVSPTWTIGFGGNMAASVAGFRKTTVI